MYHSDLAEQIEGVVQNALNTNNFSELNKNIGDAVKTSIAQIGTNQNRFYQNYEDSETTTEQLEHVDGEIVNGDMKADFAARRRQAMAEAERARANSRQAQEARRRAAKERQRSDAADAYNRSRTQYSYRNTTNDTRTRQERRRANQNQAYQDRARAAYQKQATERTHRQTQTDIVPISRKPAGRVSGTLLTVFGSIGLGFSVAFFLLFGLMVTFGHAYGGMSYSTYSMLLSHFLLPCTSISCLMLGLGLKKRNRIKRFYQYVRQLRGRAYCSIKELSSHIGRSDHFVLKDLKKMIRLGMFPEGHIDDQRTCVMLNGTTYEQYLKAQRSYLTRSAEEPHITGENHSSTTQASENASADASDASNKTHSTADGRQKLPPKVLQVLTSGESYLTKIREANAAIPGVIITEKLEKLEQIIAKITARIEEHPEQVDDLDKFIGYYLPTTLKLVNAYREFDAQPVQGENILTAKKEIEATLDTILYAFETLLDSLYEDDAMDISTDISVLQTMFAQEGLTKSAFAREKSSAPQ